METHFQTSFIPKKPTSSLPGGGLTPLSPLAAQRHSHSIGSVYMAIAVTLFIISILAIGGVFAWKQVLLSSQASDQKKLAEIETKFNVEQISFLKAQSAKISLARQLVTNHLAVSKIFSVISQLTDENIRFRTLDLTIPPGNQTSFQLALSGYGKSFPSVAFQSDVLNSLEKYGLRGVVKNAIVSDPVLNHDGTVTFGFTAQVDPSSFYYAKNMTSAGASQTAGAANAANAAATPSGSAASTASTTAK
jgi:hypothetical protein